MWWLECSIVNIINVILHDTSTKILSHSQTWNKFGMHTPYTPIKFNGWSQTTYQVTNIKLFGQLSKSLWSKDIMNLSIDMWTITGYSYFSVVQGWILNFFSVKSPNSSNTIMSVTRTPKNDELNFIGTQSCTPSYLKHYTYTHLVIRRPPACGLS